MTLTPKPLKPGWLKSCALMTTQLLLRSKACAFLVFIIFPITTFLTHSIVLKLLGVGISLIVGCLYCLKQDTHQNTSWRSLTIHTALNPEPYIAIIVSMIFFSHFITIETTSDSLGLISHLLLLKYAVITLYICATIAPIIILALAELTKLSIYLWNKLASALHLHGKTIDTPNLDKYAFQSIPVPTKFGFFLVFHGNLRWIEATTMSINANKLMTINQKIICTCIILISLLTGMFFITLPFIYSVYKHMFWEGTLTEKEKSLSTSIQPSAEYQA